MNTLAAIGINHLSTLNTPQMETLHTEGQDEVISRLKFIGRVGQDEKIDVRNIAIQPNKSIVTRLYRLVYQDNRGNCLRFLKAVIERAFEILELHLNKQDETFCRNLVQDLVQAKQGIKNLKQTYEEAKDEKFCCDMVVLLEKIDAKLLSINKNYPELFRSESSTV